MKRRARAQGPRAAVGCSARAERTLHRYAGMRLGALVGKDGLEREYDDSLRGCLDYIADILRGLDYQVIAVPNAQSALTIVLQSEKRLDLLLTDIVMPGINGRELARRAQEMRPTLPVLYMTGYSRNAVVHQGRLDEGVELLQKPVSQAELASRVRKILDDAQSRNARGSGTG